VKILIVEDDADSGDALAQLLLDFGYEVRLVMQPTLARGAAREFLPDVALLDIGLPVISGYEVLAQLRALPELAHCRFVAITAYVGPGIIERSFDAGFEHHLTKPLSIPQLLRCIDGAAGAPKLGSAARARDASGDAPE